jgi:SAM-dependent methyltransferase
VGSTQEAATKAATPTQLSDVFADAVVARLYERRPPYPEGILAALARRLAAPRSVLDAGAGTGSLSRRMTAFAERIDAVEPSAAMIAEGQRLPGGSDPRIRWIQGRAEDVPLDPPYGLVVCGESLHWMALDVVLPRFRAALAPAAHLAIIGNANIHGPYSEDVWSVTDRYAAVARHPETADAIAGVRASGLFTIEGEDRTDPMPFEQSVDEYIEFLHSTSVLTRAQLGDRASVFDAAVRAVFARHGIDRLRYEVVGSVTWAKPK